MTYEQWLSQLRDMIELETGIPRDQHQAVFNITDDAWLKMYDDGLTPEEAFSEECNAAWQLS